MCWARGSILIGRSQSLSLTFTQSPIHSWRYTLKEVKSESYTSLTYKIWRLNMSSSQSPLKNLWSLIVSLSTPPQNWLPWKTISSLVKFSVTPYSAALTSSRLISGRRVKESLLKMPKEMVKKSKSCPRGTGMGFWKLGSHFIDKGWYLL